MDRIENERLLLIALNSIKMRNLLTKIIQIGVLAVFSEVQQIEPNVKYDQVNQNSIILSRKF